MNTSKISKYARHTAIVFYIKFILEKIGNSGANLFLQNYLVTLHFCKKVDYVLEEPGS